MTEPKWQFVKYPPINFQDITISPRPSKPNAPKSLDEVDPKLLETYEKLGIPLRERGRLAGVAVDAVFDSVSVGTTYRETSSRKRALFSARSAKPCTNIPISSKNISARSCRTRTTITPRSIPPSSATVRSATSRKACVARWNFRPISASTPRSPASSNARSIVADEGASRQLPRRLHRADAR